MGVSAPVGCACLWSWGRASLWSSGVCSLGGGGGGCIPACNGSDPTVNRILEHASENITLPQLRCGRLSLVSLEYLKRRICGTLVSFDNHIVCGVNKN